MKRISLRKLAVVAALGAAAAITGAALAAGGGSGHDGARPPAGGFASSHGRVGGGFGSFGIGIRGRGDELSAAASYLGLSESDLLAQLRSGKTLAQVATATEGKSVDGLVDALVAAAKTKLDAAVTAGRLTADQEQAILADLRTRVADLVNGVRPVLPKDDMDPGHGLVMVGLSTAASYLGLSENELLARLRSGKTLAQIATATSGKSVDGLVDALVAAAKTKLDAATKAGRLTSDQEQTILANLRTRIADLVNGMQFTGGWGARHGGPLVGPRWSHGSSI